MFVLIHTTGGHFKFWAWDVETLGSGKASAIFRWGRIGSDVDNAQTTDKVFPNEFQAIDYARAKVAEKRKKGYVHYQNDIYDLVDDVRKGVIAPGKRYRPTIIRTSEDEGVYDDGDGNAVDIGGNPIRDVFPESMRQALESYRRLANERNQSKAKERRAPTKPKRSRRAKAPDSAPVESKVIPGRPLRKIDL
jgi:predicted DNA-binding WGR domain protein